MKNFRIFLKIIIQFDCGFGFGCRIYNIKTFYFYVYILSLSGCITSAESVLIAEQSQEELYKILEENVRVMTDLSYECILICRRK